jgi:hypothetical protein
MPSFEELQHSSNPYKILADFSMFFLCDQVFQFGYNTRRIYLVPVRRNSKQTIIYRAVYEGYVLERF